MQYTSIILLAFCTFIDCTDANDRRRLSCTDHATSSACSSSTSDCTWYDEYGCYATKKEEGGKEDGKEDGKEGGKSATDKTGSLTGPKILVLHGGGGSALGQRSSSSFQDLMSSLSGYQFIYAQGGYAGSGGGALWIPDPPSKGQPTTSSDIADASLQILDDIVRTQGPFYGILGYSQGSAFVPVYLAHAPANTFQVAMMFCGYLTTTHQGLLGLVNAASPFNNIVSLVWMGGQDTIITNSMTDEQAGKFTNPVRLTDPNGGHSIPASGSPTYENVVSFVNNNPATAAHQGKDSTAPYPPSSGTPLPANSPSPSPSKFSESSSIRNSFEFSIPYVVTMFALFLFYII